MNEIIVRQTRGEIDANFDEVKAHIDGQLEVYRNMVFTEETKKQAKETVAELRKGKKELADRCKAVKKEWMIPLDAFMEKADELAKMFDEPIEYINEQIDVFEQKRIEGKRIEISNIYAECIDEEEIKDIIPLTRIYNNKWENATVKRKEIVEEIMSTKASVKSALETIRSMKCEVEQNAIDIYKRTLDVLEAVKYISNYEDNKRQILMMETERIRKEEEERIRAEERRKIEAEKKAEIEKAEAVAEAQAEVIEQFMPTDTGAHETPWQYTLMLTPDSKEKVEMFLNSIGIEFYAMEV